MTDTDQMNNNEEMNSGDSTVADRKLALLKPKHPMEALIKSVAFSTPKIGEIVHGTVIEKRGSTLFVDLGIYGIGIVFGRELRAAHEIIKALKEGDPISGKVVEIDNEEGYTELSLKEAGAERGWEDLRTLMQAGEIFELPVTEANRGGLILELKGIKGFLPASQLSSANYPRVDGGDKEKIFLELQKLVGKSIKVKVLDINAGENKLIFTEKGQNSQEFFQEVAKYKVGDTVEGEIMSVADFGAFMKFGEKGIEGLIHISEIDWTLIENPRDVLKPGDKVQAKIIDIQGEKISLSLKQLKNDPWVLVAEKYHKGDTVHGKVTKFNPFGAFIGFDGQIQGLVHISEFGTETRMKKEIETGREYDFKVLLVDPKEHRMSLGMMREEKEGEKPESAEEQDLTPQKTEPHE